MSGASTPYRPSRHRTVILGAGHAGGRAALALSDADPDRDIVLVGREAHPPYERPPVSKDILAGKAEATTAYLKPADHYAERGVELRLGCEVVRIDRGKQQLLFAHGDRIAYDTLIVATGARPRRLAVPGADGPTARLATRLVYLRDIDDALALKNRLTPGLRVAI